jgi:hypothetical protein
VLIRPPVKKPMTAMREESCRLARPAMAWPEAHPPAYLAPKPIRKPPPTISRKPGSMRCRGCSCQERGATGNSAAGVRSVLDRRQGKRYLEGGDAVASTVVPVAFAKRRSSALGQCVAASRAPA